MAFSSPPPLRRENVGMTHGVYCYRDRLDYRWASIGDSDPWSGICICHHAVWHSCPDAAKGGRMFDAMTPTLPEKDDVIDGEVVPPAWVEIENRPQLPGGVL